MRSNAATVALLVVITVGALCMDGGRAEPHVEALAFVVGLMIAGLVMSAAGAGYSAYSSYQAGKAQAEYQEGMAQYNAAVARNEALREQQTREVDSKEERREALRRRERIRAMYAKSGVLLSGTPELFLAEQALVDEVNILNRDRESAYRAANMQSGALMTLHQGEAAAKMSRAQGTAGAISATLQGAAGVLQGAGQTVYMASSPTLVEATSGSTGAATSGSTGAGTSNSWMSPPAHGIEW